MSLIRRMDDEPEIIEGRAEEQHGRLQQLE
jgi:hypothetical protein